jgi:hypothetical protein
MFAGLVILITGNGLIEYFWMTFLSMSKVSKDWIVIGMVLGGFLTFYTLKLKNVPI